jgi:hypothetical protein
MSRHEHKNDSFTFAYGADHVCGAFLQVWCNPDDDAPVVSIDNMGIVTHGKVPAVIADLVATTWLRFDAARKSGIAHPNIDHTTVNEFAKKLGFADLQMDIFRALD